MTLIIFSKTDKNITFFHEIDNNNRDIIDINICMSQQVGAENEKVAEACEE